MGARTVVGTTTAGVARVFETPRRREVLTFTQAEEQEWRTRERRQAVNQRRKSRVAAES